MTKEEALKDLGQTHILWTPEHATKIAGVFGIDPKDVPIRIHKDNRNEIKGLTLSNSEEGDEDFGVESLELALTIAQHLGVAHKAGEYFGRGRQQRAYVAEIRKAL